MKKLTMTILSIATLGALSNSAQAQRVCSAGSLCNGRSVITSAPAYNYQTTVLNFSAGHELADLESFIDSLKEEVNYYTYGEIFLPLKAAIANVINIQAVFGYSHLQTFNSTMDLLKLVDKNWSTINEYKYTGRFFETINALERIILQLKRDTYL